MKEEGGGGSEIFSTTKEGAPKKLNRYRGGLLKFQASSFNIFIPPPLVILNELSLTNCSTAVSFASLLVSRKQSLSYEHSLAVWNIYSRSPLLSDSYLILLFQST